MRITVKLLTGGSTEVECSGGERVASVKAKLQGFCGKPPELQRLIYSGKELQDDMPMGAAEISGGKPVNLLFRRPPAGGGGRGGGGWQKPGIEQLLSVWEITVAQKEDMLQLSKYDTVFLLDDSGSMYMEENTSGVKQSRWAELQQTIGPMIEFATYFDEDGTDIHFLNRPSVEGVTDPRDRRLEASFAKGPGGTTPLTRRIQEIVGNHRGQKPLLVMIATDGVPDGGADGFKQAARRILTGGKQVRFGIIACTQDDRAVGWLNQLDDDPAIGDKIDVCDDYISERQEVLAAGRWRQFLKSDYIVKCLLGPICPKYDSADAAVSTSRGVRKGGGSKVGGRNGGGVTGGDDLPDDVIAEVTDLFLLFKAGGLTEAEFTDAKAATHPGLS